MSDQTLEAFSRYLREEKKLSENTAVSYCRDVHQFCDWLARDRGHTPALADHDDISSYLRYLLGIGKSHSTVARCSASMKCFYSYLMRINKIKQNPVVGISLENDLMDLSVSSEDVTQQELREILETGEAPWAREVYEELIRQQ